MPEWIMSLKWRKCEIFLIIHLAPDSAVICIVTGLLTRQSSTAPQVHQGIFTQCYRIKPLVMGSCTIQEEE